MFIISIDCTIPAPSSCEPSPISHESKCPPTKIISLGNSDPLISAITLCDFTSAKVLHCCLNKNLRFGLIFKSLLSFSAELVLIAAAGILLLSGKSP